MSIYSTATDDELRAGLKWHQAKVSQLDRESTSENFAPEARSGWAGPIPEREHYFGGGVPEHLSAMSTYQAHQAWQTAERAGALGRGLLESVARAMQEIDYILEEQWLRSQQDSDT